MGRWAGSVIGLTQIVARSAPIESAGVFDGRADFDKTDEEQVA
jgi:hypothetical protein